MRILLISVVTEKLNMVVLPLGMAYIAAAVRNAGYDVQMLNLSSTETDFYGILKKQTDSFQPEVVGISMRNVDDQAMINTQFLVEPVRDLVRTCKQLTNAKIVLGGAGYSIFPESALSYTGADMGIKGEGENAFVELIDRLEKEEDFSQISGLVLPVTGQQRPAAFPKTLKGYAMPLPKMHLDIPDAVSDDPLWIPIQTRRGCPMDCSYCSTSAIEGRTLRKHPPKQVVENIKQYLKAGFKYFHFVDNTFNFPSSYAEELCDRIFSENLKIKSRCIVYPSNIKERLVKKMAKAGMKEVSLGFESGCDIMLKTFKKRFVTEDVRQISQMFKRGKISQMGFLLLGGPGETRDTVIESLEFADELNLDFMKVSVGIRIYPHTALAETAVKEGKIDIDDDLLMPRFYIMDDLKDWLPETVKDWAKDRSNWMI